MKQLTISIDSEIEQALAARSKFTGLTLEQLATDAMTLSIRRILRDRECQCGALELASRDPSSPVEFNIGTNEYEIVKKTEAYESRTIIRYCFFCGGRAPKSQRERLFHIIDNGETSRLSNLLNDVKTVEDVLEKLGPPDKDLAMGAVISPLEDVDDQHKIMPSLHYTNLSPVAVVTITVDHDGKIGVGVSPKPRDQIVA